LSFLRPNPGVSLLTGILHLARAELWILSWLEDAGYQPDVYTDLDFELFLNDSNLAQLACFVNMLNH